MPDSWPADPPSSVAAAYCGRCGDPLAAHDHADCARLLQLEPPRYCPACRRRLVVQVTPGAWTARCVEHGERSEDTWVDSRAAGWAAGGAHGGADGGAAGSAGTRAP